MKKSTHTEQSSTTKIRDLQILDSNGDSKA